jgi:hypothetical protein
MWEPNYVRVGVRVNPTLTLTLTLTLCTGRCRAQNKREVEDIIMHHIQMISIYAHFSCLLSQKGHTHHPINWLQL